MGDERMAAVARAYLGPAPRSETFVVVGGEDPRSTAAAARDLQQAAASVGLSSVLVHRRRESVDLELGRQAHPTLVICELGETSEADAGQLSEPASRGADLLLWCPRPGKGPRWIYLLSLWVWSLQPRQVRCVVDRSSIGDFDLSALRYRLCKGLRRTEVGEGAELLLRPDRREGDHVRMFYDQILQSLLSDSSRRSVRLRSPRRRRAAVAMVTFGLFLTLLGLGSARADSPPEGPTAVVEFVAFADARESEMTSPDGSKLYQGDAYAVRVEPGVGAWSKDGTTFTMASRRPDTRFQIDGEDLVWGSGSHRVHHRFVAHAPEYSVVITRGRVEMLDDRVSVHAVLGRNPISGRGGVLVSLVLAGIIFFLMWRANGLQKRLDAPRHSVRHPRPPQREEPD